MDLVGLTEFLVKSVAKNPDMVSVKEFENTEDNIVIQVLVSEDDIGVVIGKGGKNANAIRTIVQASSYINDKTNNFLNLTEKDFEEMAGILWLLNTIYTKSEWVKEFDVKNNFDGNFANLDKSTSKVTYMNRTDEGALYYETDNYCISSLALKHGLNFNILLPKKSADYQKVLSDKAALNNMYNFKNLRIGNYGQVNYIVPKFEDRQKYDLVGILPSLTSCSSHTSLTLSLKVSGRFFSFIIRSAAFA